MQHNLWTAPLYRVLASVMTELERAGEIRHRTKGTPLGDNSNMSRLIEWDTRRNRYVYNAEGAQ